LKRIVHLTFHARNWLKYSCSPLGVVSILDFGTFELYIALSSHIYLGNQHQQGNIFI
jgi:hypothetical protein